MSNYKKKYFLTFSKYLTALLVNYFIYKTILVVFKNLYPNFSNRESSPFVTDNNFPLNISHISEASWHDFISSFGKINALPSHIPLLLKLSKIFSSQASMPDI